MGKAFKAQDGTQQQVPENDRLHSKVDRPADVEAAHSADIDHSPEQANLRPYVLNGTTALEQEHQKNKRYVGGRVSGALIGRTKAVTLDPARIDPHLVGIIDGDPLAAFTASTELSSTP